MVGVVKETAATKALSEFSSGVSYEDLPDEVVDWAKYLCLDFAGVTLNGSTTRSAQAVVDVLKRAGREGPSAVIGTPYRALPEYAALANGTAYHSIELDDVNNEASLHPGVVVYPTAMAMADVAAPVDGKVFIAAVAVGYDIIVRLGRALKPAEHYGRGFHPTATCGAFGAAAVSARLMGLEGDPFVSALGIAGSQAAGSMEFLAQGAWTKRFHPGWAAHSGIWAAMLAREGFTGPSTIVEGEKGFLHAYSGDPDSSRLLEDLGDPYQITRTSIKPHACCRYNQGPIDCVLDLVKGQGLAPDDVDELTIGVLSTGYDIVAAPEDEKRRPESVVDMQFSLPFGAAVALLYGQASLDEHAPGVAERPEVREAMTRVRCVRDPALDAQFPRRWPAWAEARTRDGRTLRSEVTYPKGDPENPLSWDEMKAKFTTLTAPVIPESRQREIIAAVESLEQSSDVRDLAALLSVG